MRADDLHQLVARDLSSRIRLSSRVRLSNRVWELRWVCRRVQACTGVLHQSTHRAGTRRKSLRLQTHFL